jgi:hypothetical protein
LAQEFPDHPSHILLGALRYKPDHQQILGKRIVTKGCDEFLDGRGGGAVFYRFRNAETGKGSCGISKHRQTRPVGKDRSQVSGSGKGGSF